MLRSCRWCGRIHDAGYDCGRRPRSRHGQKMVAESTAAETFRRTSKWKKKSLEIRDRDKNLCQICLRNLYMTFQTLTHYRVSVHHIVPISEDPDSALDDGNLITLCQFHHELAESGFIPRDELKTIVAAIQSAIPPA